MARGSAGESVLHKHLRILDAFDPLHPFLTLSEIADAAGLARSSAHRLVGELEREGLLERAGDRTYRLGVRLWEFAARAPGAVGLRELARPWLSAVHSRIRQHTQLGIRAGRDVLFVERMSTPHAVVNATLIGGRTPLPVSSSGLVLLAHADDAVVDDVVACGWAPHTERTLRDGRQLRTALGRVRAEGVAVLDGHVHLESRGVAVPVRGADGTVIAALGVVVPNDGSPPAATIETLSVAATGISRAMAGAAGDHGGGTGLSPRSWAYIAALHARTAGRGVA